MKMILLLALTAITGLCTAQTIEKFYAWNWKEVKEPTTARFYAVIEKTDSGWIKNEYYIREKRLHMRGRFAEAECKTKEGTIYYFHPNGKLSATGTYNKNELNGLWLAFFANGDLRDSTNYSNDQPVGTCLQWHSNYYLSDSSVYNPDGSGITASWFDNGSPSSSGRYEAGFRKVGNWKYWHRNGKISCIETYQHGELSNKEYFTEEGNKMSDTSNNDRRAIYMGNARKKSDWATYLSNHAYWPLGYVITGGDEAVVVVSAVVDEEGKVRDAEVITSFYPSFDAAALQVIKNSPDWRPAIDHNRRVKYVFNQPITFRNR